MASHTPSPGARLYQDSYYADDTTGTSAQVAEATVTQLNAAMRNAEALTAFIDEEEYLIDLLRELEGHICASPSSFHHDSGGRGPAARDLQQQEVWSCTESISQHDALMYIYTRTEELIQEALQLNTTVGSLEHLRTGGSGLLSPSEVAAMSERQQQLSVAAQKLWLERQEEAKQSKLHARNEKDNDREEANTDAEVKEANAADQLHQQEKAPEAWRQRVEEQRKSLLKWIREFEALQHQHGSYQARIADKQRELGLLAHGDDEPQPGAREGSMSSNSTSSTPSPRQWAKKQQRQLEGQSKTASAGSATISELETEVAKYRAMCDTLTKILAIPV